MRVGAVVGVHNTGPSDGLWIVVSSQPMPIIPMATIVQLHNEQSTDAGPVPSLNLAVVALRGLLVPKRPFPYCSFSLSV